MNKLLYTKWIHIHFVREKFVNKNANHNLDFISWNSSLNCQLNQSISIQSEFFIWTKTFNFYWGKNINDHLINTSDEFPTYFNSIGQSFVRLKLKPYGMYEVTELIWCMHFLKVRLHVHRFIRFSIDNALSPSDLKVGERILSLELLLLLL